MASGVVCLRSAVLEFLFFSTAAFPSNAGSHHSALTDIDLEECDEEVEGGRPPLPTGEVLEDGPEHNIHVLGGAAKPLDMRKIRF